jgi:Tfp pilus assembly PilM family ATPase
VKDEKEFVSRLGGFGRAHGLSYVKVSVPEEKAYIFQTDVPAAERKIMEQNIEFKLEENVPLSAPDAVFCFDLLPYAGGGAYRASVTVVPLSYVEHYTSLIRSAGLAPVAFEIAPKSIARAVVPADSDDTRLVVHAMNRKTGIYVLSGNIASFASTVASGAAPSVDRSADAPMPLEKEIDRVLSYWSSHGTGKAVKEVILVGRNASVLEAACRRGGGETPLTVHLADVWCNSLDVDRHLPPVSQKDSLEYAVAAGLALDTPS